jgi:hypothetical protein
LNVASSRHRSRIFSSSFSRVKFVFTLHPWLQSHRFEQASTVEVSVDPPS